MKKCKFKDYRSFTHCSEAYYAKSLPLPPGVVDEFFFGLSCGGGGTHGEMKMEFRELGGDIVAELQVFDDGWEVLASFTDLLAEMAKVNTTSSNDKSITPKEFSEMLIRCGFKDQTQRDDPNPVAVRSHTPSRDELEEALRSIAGLPGRSIADEATFIARKALRIEKMP
jgi:hypothetical protein